MESVSSPLLAPGLSPVECPTHLLLYSTGVCWLCVSVTQRADLYVLGYGLLLEDKGMSNIVVLLDSVQGK